MYEEFLEGTGLTKNESLVYLSLLKISKSKTGKIVQESKVSSGKIYETLYKLVDKGLVKMIIENNVKYFIANHPDALLRYLKEKEQILHQKEQELEKLLPGLEKLQKINSDIETVSLIKGFRGVSPLIESVLPDAKNIMVMGVRSSKNVKFNNFWKKWHDLRIELKKNARMLFSDKGTEYWKYYKKLPYTQVREILSFSPSAIMIIDDNVFIFSYEEELTCIHISTPLIAKSFENFFESMWTMAK